MSVRVGLTGGMASGKSTVSGILGRLGATVIDADLLAREVVGPGTPGLAAIVQEFGPEILLDDGTLDRAALGAIVFADPERRSELERIIHPQVLARAAELEAGVAPGGVVVHDIPLLAETGRAGDFDAVVVVDVPVELQRRRMVEDRGMSREDADARIAAQATREQRRAVATHVIDNVGSLEELEATVERLFVELHGLAGR